MEISMRWLRLRAVWLLIIPFLWLARPTPVLLLIGGLFALGGLAIRGWAAAVITKETELTVHGPYAHTRNPLYLGSLLLGIGVVAAGGRWIVLLFFLLFFALVYRKTMHDEEEILERRFGDRYHDYASNVPLFVPRLVPYSPAYETVPRAPFSLARYRGNREWEAVLGVVAGFGFLATKLFLE